MMSRLFSIFNIVCLSLLGFFVLGIMYLWRGEFVVAKIDKEIASIAPVSYADVRNEFVGVEDIFVEEDVDENNLENESDEENDVEEVVVQVRELVSLDELPDKMNLAVPFTSQAPEKNWSQPWQDACEEAAVLMVDAYYESYGLSPLFAKDEILKLLAYEEKFDWGGSIEVEKVDQLFNFWTLVPGLESTVLINPTVDDIKQQVASGRPVLVLADGKVLPNPYFQNGGPAYHALVVRGYTEDSFITNDPGTQHGENFVYKYDDLMNSIRDWNGGDVKNGKRAVLIFSK